MIQSTQQQLVKEIIEGFVSYMRSFNDLSRKAPLYFRERNWDAMQNTHRSRLRQYKDHVQKVVSRCKVILAESVGDRKTWSGVKNAYSLRINTRHDQELAESFFNAVIRKAVPGLAVDEQLMFVHENYGQCEIHQNDLFYNYPQEWGLEKIFRTMLDDFDFGVPFADQEQCIRFLVKGVKDVILTRYSPSAETSVQVLKTVFYRNKAAYLIGRTYIGNKWMPFI